MSDNDSGPSSSSFSSSFSNAFSSGKDRARDAGQCAEETRKGTPGAGHGDWDEDEESVSGDVSAYVHSMESARDPWHPRQTAHGALNVMKGFLGPHFENFQTVADGQRKVSEDPGSTSGMATSAARSTAGKEAFGRAAKISDKDQPKITEEMRRRVNGASYEAEGAVLVATGLTGHAMDVAVDPSGDKAYVTTDGGTLYAVDLTTHTRRQLMTSGEAGGSLGLAEGVATDGKGNAYVTDSRGGRLLRVDLSTGHTAMVSTVPQASGISLDDAGRTAYVTSLDGNLSAVDLRERGERKQLATGLGTSTSAVALDGEGIAYTGNRDETGSLRKIDLRAVPPGEPSKVAASSERRSGGIGLDGTGTAYVSEHWLDCLYTIDLASGRERMAVRAGVGAFSPLGIAVDSVHDLLYVSTWEGQLWRFSLRVLRSPELIEIRTVG